MIFYKKNGSVLELRFKVFLSGATFYLAQAAIKRIKGREFVAAGKESYWTIPCDQLDNLKAIYKDLIDEDEKIEERDFLHKEIPTDLDYINEFKLKPYPFQILGINFLLSQKGALLGDQMGVGKAQPLNSKILTPDGWITFKEAKIGQKVINSQGNISKITGIFPQGIKKVYEVIFNDGFSAQCCEDHLWAVNTANRNYCKCPYKIKSLKEIKEKLFDKNGNSLHFIQTIKPINYPKKDLPIDSYLLGLILGDGSISSNSCGVTTTDDFIQNYVEKMAKEKDLKIRKSDITYYFSTGMSGKKNYYVSALKKLGLMGHTSHTKFIPKEYLFSDLKSRIELLQGLLDADGCVFNNNIEYSTVSYKLLCDVGELVQSLGGKVKTNTKMTSWTHNSIKKHSMAYRMTISLPDEIKPFKLSRKADLWKGRPKYKPIRAIKHVKYVGEEECCCIMVDSSDHLYVTDNYILTHNTAQTLGAAYKAIRSKKAKKVLIICPASLKYQWGEEIEKFFDFPKYKLSYMVIDGTAKKRQKQYDSSISEKTNIIITNYETVRNDIKFYSSQKWDILGFDEAHRLTNKITKTYRAISKIKANYIWAATGTPIQNKPSELFHLFALLNPKILGAWKTFRDNYIILGESYGKTNVPIGTKNLSDLHNKIAPYFIRRLKKDIAKQLPEMIITKRSVEMTTEQKRLHDIVYDDLINLIKEVSPHTERNEDGEIIKQDKRADAILGLMVLMQEIADDLNLLSMSESKMVKKYDKKDTGRGPSPKTKELMEILKEYLEEDTKGKAVIFSKFARMQTLLYPEVSKLGKTVVVNGSMSAQQKQMVINQFKKDENINFILASDSLNYGINLAEAKLLINYDLHFNPAVIDQRNNRIHRIDSTGDSVNIINLVGYETIDDTIFETMEQKRDLSNQIIENTDEETQHMKKLIKIIEKKMVKKNDSSKK